MMVVLGGGVCAAGDRIVTFNQHIAPIIRSECAGCHRSGGGAPFSLLTYRDVRSRAALIDRVTRSRYMPPWKPEPGYGDLLGARRLSDRDLALIAQWLKDGLEEGEPANIPPVPDRREWQLGTPDLIVTMPMPYELGPEGGDVFRSFVIPIPISTMRYVRAVELVPGSAPAVHHAAIKIDQTRSSRALDEEDPQPGYDGGGARTAAFPDGHFFSWTPGQSPTRLPDDMGWQLEPGSDLVLEMHLTPTGKPEAVQARVGLFFTDKAPTRRPFVVRLGSQSIDIPPGERAYQVTDSFVLPVGVEILAVQPHAHYLARQIRGLARLPDGTIKWLVYIKEWDFRWQDVYRLREPLTLPPGSRLEMSYSYDNSLANPRNPHRPPERVTFGQTTGSEMGNLWVQVVTQTAGERATLERSYQPQLTAGDIAGYLKMIEITPGDPRLHADLGFLYITAGRLDDATRELRRALDLTPKSAIAHYALGTVLLTRKRLDDARQQLEMAIALDPELVDAHLNLGVVAHAQDRLDEAIGSYSTVLRLRPDQSQAHYNLGRAYQSRGHVEQAIGEFQLALKLRPDDPDTLISLGSVLVSSGRPDEALACYRRALALDADRPGLRATVTALLDRSHDAGRDRRRH